MADDDTPPDDPKKGDPAPDPDAGAKKALDAERRARRDAEKALADVQKQLKELTDKDKSDVEKLTEQVAQLTKDRDDQAAKALRAEVAMSKGLNAAQAKRLTGGTLEELEADADDLLATFKGTGGDAPPTQKPRLNLSGGADPTGAGEETNPAKLAADLPRY